MSNLIDHNKLVNIMFAFFVGTMLALLLQYKIVTGSIALYMFMIAISCFELVLLFFVFHYVSLAKDKTAKVFKSNPKLVQFTIAIVLGITFIAIGYTHDRSILLAIRDLVMVGLVIIVLPYVNAWFEKKKSK